MPNAGAAQALGWRSSRCPSGGVSSPRSGWPGSKTLRRLAAEGAAGAGDGRAKTRPAPTLRANRHGVHTSVQALENDIRDWIAIWNDNPRPFTWTQGPGKVVK